MYLVRRKAFLLVDDRDGQRVSVADTRQRVGMAPFPQIAGGYPGIPKDTRGRLEGSPSSRQGTSTSTAGRKPVSLSLIKQDNLTCSSDLVLFFYK
jgi:hypothetical protein